MSYIENGARSQITFWVRLATGARVRTARCLARHNEVDYECSRATAR